MLYLVIIALILFYLYNGKKEGYESGYMSLNTKSDIGVPSYSSPDSKIDWLKIDDLQYGKLVPKLQGKDRSVSIRNLV